MAHLATEVDISQMTTETAENGVVAVDLLEVEHIKRGVVLGLYLKREEAEDVLTVTSAAEEYNAKTSGRLAQILQVSSPMPKKGRSILLFNLTEEHAAVSVVGLGPADAGYNEREEYEEQRENIRSAVSHGAQQLRDAGIVQIEVDPCGDAEAAAEGCCLGLFSYDDLKNESTRKPGVQLSIFGGNANEDAWHKGLLKADGQNVARQLMEMPSNVLTPTKFAEKAVELLEPLGLKVVARDASWAEGQKMNAFLSVARGSAEPPVFLEIIYEGAAAGTKPLVIVGSGITFNSGGLSLKPAIGMDKMRGDKGGAACAVGIIYTLAALHVPINATALIPLSENMPSGKANKPGDIITAMNGKTIQVFNTEGAGCLVLADALCYAMTLNPRAIVDIATLPGGVDVSLGSGVTGVFTTSTKLWQIMWKSGTITGDRVWRMPLFDHYKKLIADPPLADVCNVGKLDFQASPCIAAAFLKEFVDTPHWLHLDITGVMENKDEISYLGKGMTGRPTRTVVEFAERLSTANLV